MVVPATVALAVILFLAVDDAGYEATRWYAAALFLLALLVLSLLVVPAGGRPPRLVATAASLFAAYAGWSYLSITWADQNADAWDGANRTALYAIVFALFALWPVGRRGAIALIGGTSLAIAVLALVALVHVDTASRSELTDLFVGGRLAWPVNYANATVCIWFLAVWPCVVLAARREVPPALRGVFASAAVLLCATSLLGQSRGWFFALPIVTVAFLAITPGRVRLAWTLLIVAVATVAVASPALHVHDVIGAGGSPDGAFAAAARAIVIAALLTGLVVTAAAFAERRRPVPRRVARRVGRAMLAGTGVVVVVGLVAGIAAVGSPVAWAGDRWDEFKGGPQPDDTAGRLTQGLGSNRYDFWRVSWDEWKRHPLVGSGADNFRHPYLRERNSLEEPYYPHSVVMRTLGQTGLVGLALLGGGIACAIGAALAAMHERRGLVATVAAGAVTSWIYFIVHGAVDWFWELPALGMAAFAMLGLAAGLRPRPALHPATARARRPLVRAPAGLAATTAITALLLVSLGAPWLSARASAHAGDMFNADPSRAADSIALLDRAASLNPWSAYPRLLQAQIGVALGRDGLARSYYLAALSRDADDEFSHLALAAIASEGGHRAEALSWARRARTLSPGDPLAEEVLAELRKGERLRVSDLGRELSARAEARKR